MIPQAAVLAKAKYNYAEDVSLGHYTHEKPARCAVICATIDYIDTFGLEENCLAQSQFVQEKQNKLYEIWAYRWYSDCRGIAGLLISIELVLDQQTKEKHDLLSLSEQLLYFCLDKGLPFKISGGIASHGIHFFLWQKSN